MRFEPWTNFSYFDNFLMVTLAQVSTYQSNINYLYNARKNNTPKQTATDSQEPGYNIRSAVFIFNI